MILNGLSQVCASSLGEISAKAQLDERAMIEEASNSVAADMPTIHPSATEEYGEVEKPESSEKPKETNEPLEEDGCQLGKVDSSEKRLENFETLVQQDITEEVEMHLVEKQESPTIVQSSIEILSRVMIL